VEASFQRKGKSAEQESVYPEKKNLEKTDEIDQVWMLKKTPKP
jgi:hypothetical protein